jgi:hypothetical protein
VERQSKEEIENKNETKKPKRGRVGKKESTNETKIQQKEERK